MFFIYSFKLTSPDDIIDTLHTMGLQLSVNSFSTRLLSSCTDEYAHTYTKQDQDREKAFSDYHICHSVRPLGHHVKIEVHTIHQA